MSTLVDPDYWNTDDQWRRRASCRGHEAEFMAAIDHASNSGPALVVCRFCPVRKPCLAYAMANGESGVWGGTTEATRVANGSRRARAITIYFADRTCDRCGDYYTPRSSRQRFCQDCRRPAENQRRREGTSE